MFEHKESKFHLALEDELKTSKSMYDRSVLVESVLKGFEDMGSIDEKMHTIIARMRK